MAIHDDNWTKEFQTMDHMKMAIGERVFHGTLGIILVGILSSPWLPPTVWNYVQGAIIAIGVGCVSFFTGYFLYKAFTGRW